MALGVQAEIRIDEDRKRNKVFSFTKFILERCVVECVWSCFFNKLGALPSEGV